MPLVLESGRLCSRPGSSPHDQAQIYDQCDPSGRTVAITYQDPGGEIARVLALAPALYAMLARGEDVLDEMPGAMAHPDLRRWRADARSLLFETNPNYPNPPRASDGT